MTAIAANAVVTGKQPQGYNLQSFKVAAGVHIYRDSLVGLHPITRYAKPYEAPDIFVGMAYEEIDNSTGSAGAKEIQVKTSGDFEFTLTSAAVTDIGKPVFGIDSSTTVTLNGHPDAFIGRIMEIPSTNKVMVRLKNGCLSITDGEAGAFDMRWQGNKTFFANVVTASNETGVMGWRLDSIGAGITAGAGILPGADGDGTKMLLDNDNEAQNVTLQTPECFLVTKGITFSAIMRLKTAGGAATDDVDFGLMTAASSLITDAIRANMDVTTSGICTAKFHLDANGNDIYLGSDNDSAVVGPSDSLIDNSLTVNKKFDIIIRVDGTVEFWIDDAQVLPDTAFAVGTPNTLFAGIINLEKSTGTGVPELRVRFARVAGSVGANA